MRYLLPLLLLLGGCGGCVSVPSHGELRATALRLDFAKGICSGTAIGRDLVLTATHCLAGGELRAVNGSAVKVVDVTEEGRDTAILRIVGEPLRHVAKRGPRPVQGQRVRWWGQPGGNSDVYREGYVSRAWKDAIVIDAIVCFGDSGSGVFSDNGEVVAVISAMTDKSACHFGLAL